MQIQKIKLQMVKTDKPIFTLEHVTGTKDIVALINSKEHYDLSFNRNLIVIGMNTKNDIILYTEVATGGASELHVVPSDIFKPLLVANCTKFILAINNPSGHLEPSTSDIRYKENMKANAKLMGLEFLDFILIADEDHYASIMKGDE